MECTLLSSSTAETIVHAYYCVARKDLASGYNVSSALVNGFINTGYAGAATAPDSTPFQSLDFCQDWKIYKVKRYLLQPGKFIRCTLTSTKMMQKYARDMQTYFVWHGKTKLVLFHQQGVPAHDTATKALLGESISQLDFKLSGHVQWAWQTDAARTVYNDRTAGALAGASAMAIVPISTVSSLI